MLFCKITHGYVKQILFLTGNTTRCGFYYIASGMFYDMVGQNCYLQKDVEKWAYLNQ